VLIVEDEPLLALNLEDMLTELGCLVIGTATRFENAMTLVEGSQFDLAVLDINLAGLRTFPVADILRRRGIPFFFTSGYGAGDLIESYVGAYLLTKPFGLRELEYMLARVLAVDTH
jgi:DNA-binding response OmpR family regulator